jgi:hypothetical protein
MCIVACNEIEPDIELCHAKIKAYGKKERFFKRPARVDRFLFRWKRQMETL